MCSVSNFGCPVFDNFVVDEIITEEMQTRKLTLLCLDEPLCIPRGIAGFEFREPYKINLSAIKIAQFVTAFSNVFGYTISYVTNRSTLKDVKWFGCSDLHGCADPYNVNTILVRLLNYPNNGMILTECSADCTDKLCAKNMINTKVFSSGYCSQGWDDLSWLSINCGDGLGTLKDAMFITTHLGRIIQRIIYVAKRDIKLPFHKKNGKRDSFDAIAQDLRTLVTMSNIHDNILILKAIKILNLKLNHSQKVELCIKAKSMTTFVADTKKVNHPQILLDQISMIDLFHKIKRAALLETTMRPRQKSLCRTLTSHPRGGFILGGQNHLIDSNSAKVEKNLERWFEIGKVGYLIFFDVEKRSVCKSSGTLVERQCRKALYQSEMCKIDFDDLQQCQSTSYAQLCDNLLPWKLQRAIKLINFFYDEQGRKKEGSSAPPKCFAFGL